MFPFSSYKNRNISSWPWTVRDSTPPSPVLLPDDLAISHTNDTSAAMGDAGDSSVAAAPSVSFQTRDLEDLLNTIDQMRSQGVADTWTYLKLSWLAINP